jgi:hypothetical protein
MRGSDVEKSRGISKGTINALINDEKVQFTVTYKDKTVTTIAIRVGIIGNELSTKLINEKIYDNLKQ